MSLHEEEDGIRRKDMQNNAATAEAGIGARVGDATPGNMTDGEGQSRERSPSGSLGETALKAPVPDSPTNQEVKPLERSRGKIVIIMAALGMAVFLAALDVTIITTALPTISEHFGSTAGYTWIGSAYLLANSASSPIWGKISDIFGRKPILLLANVVFMVGSLLAALSVNIGMLITARAIQGMGGGGLVVLVNICISDLFSMRSRGAYFGIIGGVWAIASAIGPVIGGAFTEKVTWRWCFYINLPLDGLAFFIILFFLDLKTPKTALLDGLKAIDWLGAITVVGGTLMFLFGLEYGGVTHPWSSPIVICLLVFGILTLVLFGLNEWKIAKYPIMPLRLFTHSSNLASLGVAFIHGMVFIASSYYLPLYFQAVRGATPLLSGVYLLPMALSLSFSSAATGIFIRKTGMYLPAIWFGLVFMTIGYGLFVDLAADSGWAKLIMYQIIAGIGIGPNFQSPLIALQTHVPPRDIATATATFGFIRQLATSMSVVIGGVVFQNEMQKQSGRLLAALGPKTAQLLSGSGAGANTRVVDALPPAQRTVAQVAFAQSLHPMWIMYVCLSVVGLLISFGIKKKVLSREHQETKTGLANEKENAAERKAEKEEHAREKASRKSWASEKANSRRSWDSEKWASRKSWGSRPGSSGTAMTGVTATTVGGGRDEHIPPVPALPKESV
ncbi:hypothetical protein LTR66_012149 [Elasticomyces elasticus]|nr:hypothetical protein LTR66_012149 [Elasticomyces elasticus]KAK5011476.1 hypothetical protein LTR28_001993 [Elasticomyces elasticus]